MNLPKLMTDFVAAQNNKDSQAYTACFSASAIVHDEGRMHTGKQEIQQWIEAANHKYQSTMKPLTYEPQGNGYVLSAEVSGSFPGSPAVLQFQLALQDNLIQSLKITG